MIKKISHNEKMRLERQARKEERHAHKRQQRLKHVPLGELKKQRWLKFLAKQNVRMAQRVLQQPNTSQTTMNNQELREEYDKIWLRVHKEEANLRDEWTKELIKVGWQITDSGWIMGMYVTTDIRAALKMKRLMDERGRKRIESEMPDYLRANGWSVSQNNPEIWVKPNWHKRDGECARTMKQAYKLQVRLNAA